MPTPASAVAVAAAWARILTSIGLTPDAVVFPAPEEPAEQVLAKVEGGAFVILEGESALGAALGFKPSPRRVSARNVIDLRSPNLSIIWETAEPVSFFELPPQARVFVKERWEGAPLAAGFTRGRGAVLWLATSPGPRGHERFPYLPQALRDLGLSPAVRSARLWAFFDSSYRLRVDPDYFAARWRESGIAALHIAAWHYFEPDPGRDAYLKALIEACHRRAILTYAWVELPHVSEAFWAAHPEWREKTAALTDAHLDWRKLMNLANRECRKEAAAGIRALLDRFDWDGVNLAELYFESLEGHENPSRFTPLNADVRREFQARHGFDPAELFAPASPRHYTKDAAALRLFLDYRAELAERIETEWIEEIDAYRKTRPHLDLVLTHVDDRLDPQTRDRIGADASRLLPLLNRHDFTFLIEDPATTWHLGPDRYPQIAGRYAPITPRPDRLAIDINIVERYQDVYPTKQQTGAEMFQEIHLAARSFPRVALYFENSILTPDLPLLAASAAVVNRFERDGSKVRVDSPFGVGVNWTGGALVNGTLWPATDGRTVWLPRGRFEIAPAPGTPPVRLIDFNGELQAASSRDAAVEFSYMARSRAIAVVDRLPARVQIDGLAADVKPIETKHGYVIVLPRGQHLVSVEVSSGV